MVNSASPSIDAVKVAYCCHCPTYLEALISKSPCTGLPKLYSAATFPLTASLARNHSLGSVTLTSYLGSTYSSTLTSSWVLVFGVEAVIFQTPRLGSLEIAK